MKENIFLEREGLKFFSNFELNESGNEKIDDKDINNETIVCKRP